MDKGFMFFVVIVGIAAFLIGPRFDLLEAVQQGKILATLVHGVGWFTFVGCFLSIALDLREKVRRE